LQLKRARLKAKFSTKLVVSLMSVVIISGVSSAIISSNVINQNVVGQAYEEVRSDLNTALHIYNERTLVIDLLIRHLSSLAYLQTAILQNNRPLLSEKLNEVKQELDINIMNITDGSGRVIVRANNFNLYGDDMSGDMLVKRVIETGKPVYGTTIVSRENLLKEGRELADKAFIKVIKTPRSRTNVKTSEMNGMCLMAAAPIYTGGRLIGVIYGGKLLNNSFKMVDRIKNLLFREERIEGYELGTVTIFMDDVRVSTNVKNRDGSRAVGTRISEEVYSKVFEQGKVWLDKAFVVNNWYLSGYSPIYNIENRVVGILYVGILEEKYNIVKRKAAIFSLLVVLITAVIAAALSMYLIRGIITPFRALVSASKDLADGNYRKIDITSSDEMGYLCLTYNKMIDAISERDKKLREQTEMQMVQSEKLASLGRLASGIAHEINNPLTGVLSYSTVLYDEITDPVHKEDLRIIIDETLRCREIVKGILDFARETKIEKQPANINKVISDVMMLLERHVNFQNIRIKKDLAENLPEISIDVNQIKSVINNLALNAADAMHTGGALAISTRFDAEMNSVVITISDTGIGIQKENLAKIFDPFYTTKETGKGTGLGLSVTYGIVKRHGGTISVESTVGKGTIFTIEFPVNGGAEGHGPHDKELV
jgi:two-component system, NtrC family, sensor kinase